MNPALLEMLLGAMAFFTFVMAARSEVNGGDRKDTSHTTQYQQTASDATCAEC